MKIILPVFSLIIGSIAHAKDLGALIAVASYNEKLEQMAYDTYWISIQNSKVSIEGPLRDILAPTGTSFYRIGVAHGCGLSLSLSNLDYLYSEPYKEAIEVPVQDCKLAKKNIEKSLTKKPLNEDDTVESDTSFYEKRSYINFVSNKSLLYTESVYYEGGAHPDQHRSSDVKSLDPNDASFFESIDAEIFVKDAKAIKPVNKEQKECLESTAQYDKIDWTLDRENFKWVYDVTLPTHRLCGYSTNFKTKVKIDTKEVGPLFPEGLKAKFKDKADGVISPDGATVITVDKTGFEVFDVTGSKPKSLYKKAAAIHGLVMQEWSSGDYVKKWDKVFTALLKKPWGPPKYEKYNPKIHEGR